MFLICTSQDLVNPAKNFDDIELADLKLQVDLIFKSEVVVIYHEGLFKFLKYLDNETTRTKYAEMIRQLEQSILIFF